MYDVESEFYKIAAQLVEAPGEHPPDDLRRQIDWLVVAGWVTILTATMVSYYYVGRTIVRIFI